MRGLPSGEVVLWARLPGRSETQELVHDTASSEATIILPAQASLQVSWATREGVGSDTLVLAPTDGGERLEYHLREVGRRTGSTRVHAPPGEYDIFLENAPAFEERLSGEAARELTGRSRLRLAAGAHYEVDLPVVGR